MIKKVSTAFTKRRDMELFFKTHREELLKKGEEFSAETLLVKNLRESYALSLAAANDLRKIIRQHQT